MIGEKLLIISAFLVINASGSALHGECQKNEHCGTFDTFCKHGTCVCRENFAVDIDTCVQLAIPSMPCKQKKDCHAVLGARSLCKHAQCACRSFHHLYNDQCIKSRGYDEICDFDYQCYCGQDCKDHMGCVNRRCACKPGFREHNRRCVIQANSTVHAANSIDLTKNSADHSTYSLRLLIPILFFVKIL